AGLVLIGCGTFDKASRDRLTEIRRERMKGDLRGSEEKLLLDHADADVRLKALGALHQRIDSVDLIPQADESERFDAQAHGETWADMLRLQSDGVYPAAFAAGCGPGAVLDRGGGPPPGGGVPGHAGRVRAPPRDPRVP